MTNFWTNQSTAPNPHYTCQACGRDLWSKRKRLTNPGAAPEMNMMQDGRIVCQRCYGPALDLEQKIIAEHKRQWLEIEQTRRTFEYYDPTAWLVQPPALTAASDNEVAVLIKNGKIRIVYHRGNLRIDSINIAAQIKRLPGVAAAVVAVGGDITVTPASARDAAALVPLVGALARGYTGTVEHKATDGQLSLF